MVYLPRGIDPELLVSQVKNTMPYYFDPEVEASPLGQFIPGQILRKFEGALRETLHNPPCTLSKEPLSHLEYFKLCVSAHYSSCATPVPTDVDNQIRHKLWPAQLPLEVALEMSDFVLASRNWDFTLVSSRTCEGLHGHLGEWFTISSAAYCALRQYPDPRAGTMRRDLLDAITDEIRHHSEVFGALWRAHNGLSCLKTAAAIAHNFGDLDRVMDMWNLAIEDPLRLNFYGLGTTPYDSNRKLRYLGRLWVAGELYKSTIEGGSMALENHRHFALRKPRCLRQSRAFLIPTGPFFDDWGVVVARGLATPEGRPSENTLEVADALLQGWKRLPKTVGYGRALRGMVQVHPELERDLEIKELPKTHKDRFEKNWGDAALGLMDEIPSRA